MNRQMPMKNKMPKIGVIGIGVAAVKTHLPILKKLSDEGLCELVAVCDLDGNAASKASKDFGFRSFFSSADEMLRTADIDTLYIISFADVHYRYGLEAIKKGLNLFVEKPPAPSLEAFNEMFEATKASDSTVAVVGFNRRFQPALQHIKSLVDAGMEISMIEAVFHKPLTNDPVPYGVQSWLMANGIHAIDVLIYIMGSLPSELYSVSNRIDQKKSTDENFGAVMKWPSGSTASLLSDNTSGGKKESYVFHASGRRFEIERGSLTEIVDGKAALIPTPPLKGYEEEQRAFLNAILTSSKPINSFSHIKDSIELTALIESGFTGRIESAPKTLDKQKPVPRVLSAVSNPAQHKEGGILVLTPALYKIHLPDLSKDFFVISKDELASLPLEKKQKVLAMLTGPGEPLSPEIFLTCPNIKIVGVAARSLKKFAPVVAFDRGIPIVNAATAYSDSVAELALMQAIAGLRKAVVSHEIMRDGGWGTTIISRRAKIILDLRTFILKHPSLNILKQILLPKWKQIKEQSEFKITKSQTRSLKGASFGIIGWGSISETLVSMLKSHGVSEIKIFSEHKEGSDSIDRVMGCDVVVLARGLSEKTKHSIGRKELSFLRSGSIFINIARGEIVEHQALIGRLNKGDVYACLDVFEPEPPKKNDPLRTMKNVFLTSHLAGGTMDMFEDVPKEVVSKVLHYLAGTPVEIITAERY